MPVGAGVGAVVGAVTAPSHDEVERSAAAHDSVLELDMLAVSLPSKSRSGGSGLRLRLFVRGTLRRAPDREEPGTRSWQHEGRKADVS